MTVQDNGGASARLYPQVTYSVDDQTLFIIFKK